MLRGVFYFTLTILLTWGAATAVGAQCGPNGMQRCQSENKAIPLTASKPAIRASIKISRPKSDLKIGAKISAQAAANIKQAEKFYDYAVNNCADSDNQCKLINFSRAIELNPKYAEAYSYRGYIYTVTQENDKAIVDFNQAIQFNPDDANAFYNRGTVYQNKQNYEAALRDYSKVIQLNPNYLNAYLNRGQIYELNNNFAAALGDYKSSVRTKPASYAGFYQLGLYYQNRGDDAAALQNYAAALVLNSTYLPIYLNRAKIYEKGLTTNWSLAIQEYTKYLDLKKDADVYVWRGLDYQKLSNYEGAMKDYNQAISIDPNYYYAYFCRAFLSSTALNQKKSAINDYSKAIELFPRFAPAYFNRGVIYYNQNNNDAALQDFTTAIQANPAYTNAYRNRALVYRRVGLATLAAEDEKKYNELNPKQP